MHTQIASRRTLVRGLRSVTQLCVSASTLIAAAPRHPQIFEWERGFGLRIPGHAEADMYLWIYEWNMFEAMQPGQHTHGTYELDRKIAADARHGTVDSPQLHFTFTPVANGAELTATVTNRTNYVWPAIAGIIPCWSPGMVPGTNPSMPDPLNRNFADPLHIRTYYFSTHGLTPLTSRAIHFNEDCHDEVNAAAKDGKLAFSAKWPTADDQATAGLIVRESEDGQWVTGVAWERFLSVQGHNPWYCMHSSILVGPLKPGESRTIRGRLYLFRGTKEDCVAQFRRDFPSAK